MNQHNDYLNSLRTQISAADSSTRCAAASDIAYFFERILANNEKLAESETTEITQLMIKALAKESNRAVRVEILNALMRISMLSSNQQIRLDLTPIAEAIETYSEEEISYVLSILGFSNNRQFLPIAKRFQNSDNDDIRLAATEAINELCFNKASRF